MPLNRSPRRRALVAVVLSTATFAVPSVQALAATRTGSPSAPTSTVAQPSPGPTTTLDPTRARQQNRTQQRQVSGQIDALRASDADVQKALTDLSAKLMASHSALDAATAATGAARDAATAAEAAEADAAAAAEASAKQVRKMAVDAYINPSSEGLAQVLASSSFSEARQRQSMLQIRTKRQGDVLDTRKAAVSEVRRKRDEAKAAVKAAEDAEAGQRAAISALEADQQQQVQLSSSINGRLDAALSEAGALASVDQSLSQQITRKQNAIAAQLAQFNASAPTTTAPPAAPPGGPTPGTVTSATLKPKGTTTTTAPPSTPTTVVTIPQLYSIADMQLVGRIYVNKSIATQVQALLAAATAAGLSLSGGGYRDSAQQIALRVAHCGTSDYAIYQMPASQCSPPTARPGTSMHEQGLAIDFTSNGALIQDHSDPAFVWLTANASRYGLFNLPSEPWHWSINGN